MSNQNMDAELAYKRKIEAMNDPENLGAVMVDRIDGAADETLRALEQDFTELRPAPVHPHVPPSPEVQAYTQRMNAERAAAETDQARQSVQDAMPQAAAETLQGFDPSAAPRADVPLFDQLQQNNMDLIDNFDFSSRSN